MEENKEQSPPQPNKALQIELNDQGGFAAKTVGEKFALANLAIQSKMVPKGYNTPAEVMIGMQFASELGLAPLTGLRFIAVINGTPSIWGDLPLSLVKKSGHLEWIEELLLDNEYLEICFANKNLHKNAEYAVCRTKRKGTEKVHETFFSMEMAKTAGLLGRQNVWKSYPQRMLQMRARSQNLKDNFGDCLLGISISEYDYNYVPDGETRNVSHSGEQGGGIAEDLNKRFLGADNSPAEVSVSTQ